jgi:transcription elongation factor GreA
MADEIVLTQASYDKLKQDLEYMKTTKRRDLAEALRKARAYGDLSENFEYHAAKKDQGILNGRIADLERQLELARIVPNDAAISASGAMGTVVRVRDLDEDDEWDYYLVDAVQADPVNDRISVQSPVGKALLGTVPGDKVEVETPGGMARYEIVSVAMA